MKTILYTKWFFKVLLWDNKYLSTCMHIYTTIPPCISNFTVYCYCLNTVFKILRNPIVFICAIYLQQWGSLFPAENLKIWPMKNEKSFVHTFLMINCLFAGFFFVVTLKNFHSHQLCNTLQVTLWQLFCFIHDE